MYIPEFWCGVGITVIIEVGLILIYSFLHRKDKK